MSLEIPPSIVDPTGAPVRRSEYPDGFIVPNVEVVGPRLLVLPAQNVDYTTPFGLFIPASAQERHSKGIVLKNGDGVLLENGTRIPPRVPEGMEIIYARYAGVELELDGVQYLIIQESDVRMVLTYRGNLLERIRQAMAEREAQPQEDVVSS